MRLAVLVSGEGTNLQAIIDAIENGYLHNVSISFVVSSNPNAHALARAEKHKIRCIVIKKEEMVSALLPIFRDVDLVVLAGFLWIIPSSLLGIRPILNVHPSLLPLFGGKGMYGDKVTAEVLKSGMKVTGVTVHLVTEEVDAGPIVLQKCIDVGDDETPSSLLDKMHPIEHSLLVQAIDLFSKKKYKIEGNRVLFF
ncbi:MAG: phosphoribosylglycinamide formyltransferase [Thermoplasmatales archaeon]